MRAPNLTMALTMALSFTLSVGSGYAMSPASGSAKPVYGPIMSETRINAGLPTAYKTSKISRKKIGVEPLRGPWRVTKSLKDKGKEPVDENGNTYACAEAACKVSRKVDEKRD